MRLDPLDVRIVRLLQTDARLSFREIAERAGSTTPTVSARVKALEDIGLVRGYRVDLDRSIIGGATYVVAVTVQPPHAQRALATVKSIAGVHRVHLLPGGRIIAEVHLRPPAHTLTHLHHALAELPGIITYDASEVIEGHEQADLDALPENVEVPCHQCHGPIHGEPVKGKFGERAHVFCCRGCLGTFRDRYAELHAASKADPAGKRRDPTAPR